MTAAAPVIGAGPVVTVLERYYGSFGGDTHQYYQDSSGTIKTSPEKIRGGYKHLTGLVEPLSNDRRRQASSANKPFFMYLALGAMRFATACAQGVG